MLWFSSYSYSFFIKKCYICCLRLKILHLKSFFFPAGFNSQLVPVIQNCVPHCAKLGQDAGWLQTHLNVGRDYRCYRHEAPQQRPQWNSESTKSQVYTQGLHRAKKVQCQQLFTEKMEVLHTLAPFEKSSSDWRRACSSKRHSLHWGNSIKYISKGAEVCGRPSFVHLVHGCVLIFSYEHLFTVNFWSSPTQVCSGSDPKALILLLASDNTLRHIGVFHHCSLTSPLLRGHCTGPSGGGRSSTL